MAWDVRAPGDQPAVRLTLSGAADATAVEESFAAALAACAEHDVWRVITDLREMTPGHTVVDLFGVITMLTELGVADRFREALLVGTQPGARELAGFYETAAVNRGLAVRTFSDEDEALTWLTS